MSTLIRCKIIREGGSVIDIGKKEYNFKPNEKGDHVAEVTDESHIGRFLSIERGYEVYETDLSASKIKSLIKQSKIDWATPVQDEEDEDEDTDANEPEDNDLGQPALIGSEVLPENITLHGRKKISLGDLVAAAFDDSGISAEEWNALSDDDREGRINAKLDALKAEAKAGKAE